MVVGAGLAGFGLASAPTAAPTDDQPAAGRPRQYRPDTLRFPDSRGRQFFVERVLPRLAANGCLLCHAPAPGDVHPAITYEHLLPYLAMGQSPTENVLVVKLADQRSLAPDQPEHVGGRRCPTEDAEPCQSVQLWWRLEFGDQ